MGQIGDSERLTRVLKSKSEAETLITRYSVPTSTVHPALTEEYLVAVGVWYITVQVQYKYTLTD